mgnify:CR=1 FL=1
MKTTKEQFDLAIETYGENRLLGATAAPGLHETEHLVAMQAALETIRSVDFGEVQVAAKAYKKHRHILRWDGLRPWGEAGRANHAAGMKAAIDTLYT